MTLTRKNEDMPDFVAKAIDDACLRGAYDARPPYQRNDYMGWINRAKQAQTKEERLSQMLRELKAGEGYMNMAWRPRD